MFIRYLNGPILSVKSCQKQEVRKNIKRGAWHIGELSIEGGFKPSAHYVLECREAITCAKMSELINKEVTGRTEYSKKYLELRDEIEIKSCVELDK